MTAVPLSSQSSPDDRIVPASATPVSALKELVAELHQEQYKIQNLLSSLGFALRSFNNLHQFLEIVPLMASRVADTDGGALVLFQQGGKVRLEQLHCHAGQVCQDIRQAILKAARQMGETAVPTPATPPEAIAAVETPLATQSGNLAASAIVHAFDCKVKQALSPETRLFAAPILVKGSERGRLYVFSRDRHYEWTPMRQQLVQLVADQAAVAIANNDLTAELRQKERLDRELEIASDIQLHLLPQKHPCIAGLEVAADCRTANRVGGDYYDFIPTDYDRRHLDDSGESTPSSQVPWSIVIGDVMGKGVPAGLIMTMTRGMLRAEVLNRHTPAQILTHLNRVMYEDLDSSHRFVTLFYSEYDPQTQILSYSNAAHNPPLWWQAADRTVQRLDTMGMLIGLDTNSDYEDGRAQLAPGDTILYYTDGFTDAIGPNGDRFEEENLIQAFQDACQRGDRPATILQHLFDRVQEFVGVGNSYGDDMTLIAIQVDRMSSEPTLSNNENYPAAVQPQAELGENRGGDAGSPR